MPIEVGGRRAQRNEGQQYFPLSETAQGDNIMGNENKLTETLDIDNLPLTIVYKIDGVEYVTKGQYLQNIDCYNKHIKQLNREIEELRTKNAELHCAMQAAQVYPEELPFEPIEVAQMLINATSKYKANAFQRAFAGIEEDEYNIYDASALRQIAEHLLVYCNNNEVK